METAFVKQDLILQRIQANHQIWLKHRAVYQETLIIFHFPVQFVHDHHFAVSKNLLAIGQRAWDPPLEKMTPFCHLRSLDNTSLLTISCTHEQDQAPSLSHS